MTQNDLRDKIEETVDQVGDYITPRAVDQLLKLIEEHKTETCIYCHKPVDQMIQPWNYNFPSSIFHIGCQISKESNDTTK